MVKKIIYYLIWMLKRMMYRGKTPLSASIIITDKCNLTCKHCNVANLGYPGLSYQEISDELRTLLSTGARILVITGGEPFMWEDGCYGLEDVITFAHTLGFYRIVVCTNGTFQLCSSADYLWVSIDGEPHDHDDIRGKDMYERIINNINNSTHRRIYVNYTVSKRNLSHIESASAEILNIPNVRGILFHLFTPYVGLASSDLRLEPHEKRLALSTINRIKWRNPIKISNTFVGLKILAVDRWIRPTWGSVVINQGDLTTCCCRRSIYDDEVCQQCGCTPAVETWVLQKMKPTAIIENLRFL
jgi:MoaA/NifB/PqqE/SkfB family radical SAM enzyme